MSKTARTSTAKYGRHGPAKKPAAAKKRTTHAAAKPRKGALPARARTTPADDVYVVVTETVALVPEPGLDFDLDDDYEADDPLENDT
ncbi:MAG: hypothetical protein JSR56_13500 [Proteobacteria bacterium]|nr:hypothetical protein [Pseudomonadota bacterium]